MISRVGILAPKPMLLTYFKIMNYKLTTKDFRLLTGWFTYINLFAWLIWLLILTTFILLTLFYLISKKLMNFKRLRRNIDVLDVFALMINQPISITMKNDINFCYVHLRGGFIVMAVAFFLFTSIYCTKLSSNIIIPL